MLTPFLLELDNYILLGYIYISHNLNKSNPFLSAESLKNLLIERTRYTPEIRFLNSGKLLISGFSIVENPLEVYAQPMNWLKELKASDPMPIQLDLKFDFLDSSSVRSVADMLKILNSLAKEKLTQVKVNWFYEKEDLDMKETGSDLSSVALLEFNVIERDINDLDY